LEKKLTQNEAQKKGYCQVCCSWRNGKCWATAMPKLNYRGALDGMCDLTTQETREMRRDYGTDKAGRIIKKG